jgi:threonine synthase
MGVFGTWVGAKELMKAGVIERLPRLGCIQQDTCSPQVNAWRDGADKILPHHLVPFPTGPARAIMRGDPTHVYPIMQAFVRESGGTYESATEEQILDAQRLIQETEGIPACPASACTLAGLRVLMEKGTVSKDEVILLNITGADREFKHPKHYTILERTEDGGWKQTQST